MDYDAQIERLHELWGAMDLDTTSQLSEAIIAGKAQYDDMDETELTGIFYEYVDGIWEIEEDDLDMFDEDMGDY